jgi:hypothetical protein
MNERAKVEYSDKKNDKECVRIWSVTELTLEHKTIGLFNNELQAKMRGVNSFLLVQSGEFFILTVLIFSAQYVDNEY